MISCKIVVLPTKAWLCNLCGLVPNNWEHHCTHSLPYLFIEFRETWQINGTKSMEGFIEVLKGITAREQEEN